MKKGLAIFTALALGAISTSACSRFRTPMIAGLVITQQVLGNGPHFNRTVMLSGNREKIEFRDDKVEFRDQTVVVDLDAGELITLNNATKTYTRAALGANTPMVWAIPNAVSADMDFKKTAAVRTVSGYKCQEYTSMEASFTLLRTTTGCFSAQAPGAAEYAAFTEHLAKKYVEAGEKITGSPPDGIPIEIKQDFTWFRKPPESAKVVTISIKTGQFPADTFAIPAGYTERPAPPAGVAAPPAQPPRLPRLP